MTNHGGLLGLSYVVSDGWKADEGFMPNIDRINIHSTPDITLFYLSPRIFPKGHAKVNKKKNITYAPPQQLSDKHIDIEACIEWVDLAEGPPPELFANNDAHDSILGNIEDTTKEAFLAGGEIEMIHPQTHKTIEKALVLKSTTREEQIDQNHFLVQLLSDDPGEMHEAPSAQAVVVVRSFNSKDIFPSGWSGSLKVPRPCIRQDQGNRKDSHKHNKIPAEAFPLKISTIVKGEAETGFASGQKLEVLLPHGEFHSGTVVEVKDQLLVIQIDSDDGVEEKELFLSPFNGTNIFPLGWSCTNNIPIMLPQSLIKAADVKSSSAANTATTTTTAVSDECSSALNAVCMDGEVALRYNPVNT